MAMTETCDQLCKRAAQLHDIPSILGARPGRAHASRADKWNKRAFPTSDNEEGRMGSAAERDPGGEHESRAAAVPIGSRLNEAAGSAS